jgi:hypothetical protein
MKQRRLTVTQRKRRANARWNVATVAMLTMFASAYLYGMVWTVIQNTH